jgi:hypothetical protein
MGYTMAPLNTYKLKFGKQSGPERMEVRGHHSHQSLLAFGRGIGPVFFRLEAL